MKDDDTSKEVAELEDEMKKVLQNRNDDYAYGRDVMYVASEKLQDLLEIAVESAQESGHPRAIEVAAAAANALGDVAAKMMDHHMKLEKLNNPGGDKANVTNQSVNVKLNTSDLLELLGRE